MAPDDQKLPKSKAPQRPVSPPPVPPVRTGWPRWLKLIIAAVLCVVVVIAIIELLPKPTAPRTGGRFNATGAIPVVTAIVANGDMEQNLYGTLTTQIWRLSLGAGYQFSPNLVAKAEYSFERGKETTGQKRDHEDMVAVEAAFKF